MYLVSEIIEIERQPYANNIVLGKSLVVHTDNRVAVLDMMKTELVDITSLSIVQLTNDNMQDVILSILDKKEMLKIILAVSKHCDWAEFCEEDFSPEELEIFLSHRDFDKAVSYAQSFLASMELKEEKTDRNKYKSICIWLELNKGEIIMYSIPKVDPNIDYSKVRITLSLVNTYSIL